MVSGAKYDGEWSGDKMHGQGQYLFANGDCFVGPYVNGKCMVRMPLLGKHMSQTGRMMASA